MNTTNGDTLWNCNNTGLVTFSPAYANGVIYLDSTDGNVYALGTPSSTRTVQESNAQPLVLATVIGFIIVVTVIFLLCRKTLKDKPDDRYKYKLLTAGSWFKS